MVDLCRIRDTVKYTVSKERSEQMNQLTASMCSEAGARDGMDSLVITVQAVSRPTSNRNIPGPLLYRCM